ncbi:MAG TPA: hydrogenase iron-sulfur subunit [Syntrophorhabdaceae bacterium]|nr:hydrogenase iron-sulfur subunit [Syntrophorhabdaceae bacterium]HQM80543.1 hydrogenase iron-sulfur subunit [Syntrophorhabdaceae bacterium]
MDQKTAGLNIAIFFCRQLDANQDKNRRAIEKELGLRIRFFPLPCSGRIELLHLLRAIEAGADVVYLVACPEGACRYREGNLRAKRRIMFAQKLIEEIGLEGARIEMVNKTAEMPADIGAIAMELLARDAKVSISPVRSNAVASFIEK